MLRFRIPLAVAIGALVAIAPGHADAQKKKPQRDVITRDELLDGGYGEQDLVSAIRTLRPKFLEKPQGVRSISGMSVMNPIMVVVDNKPMGGVETLSSIIGGTVEEVRYLDPSKAGVDYGDKANGGAIVIKSFKPKSKPKVTVVDSVAPKPN